MSTTTEEGYVYAFEIKTVKTNGEERQVLNARVAFGRSRYDKDKNEYIDTGTIWADLSLWGARADAVSNVLKPGASILTVGRFYQRKWKHKDTGEDMYGMGFRADQIAILPRCLKLVEYKESGVSAAEAHQGGADFDDDIPF